METINQNNSVNDVFFIKVKSEYIKINPQNIFMIEAMSDYIVIHSVNKKYKVHTTMKSIIDNFPVNDFIRVHNSYIVRIDKITMIKNNNCIVNKKIIPVSRAMRKNLLNKIKIIAA